MGPEGAVNIVFRSELAEADDPDARREELIADYKERFANPYAAAERGYVDDVIQPRRTRPVLDLRARDRALEARAHAEAQARQHPALGGRRAPSRSSPARSASSANDGSSRSRSGIGEPRLRACVVEPADRRVLLGELLVEPAVGRAFGFRPRDRPLEERDRLVRAAERAQRLADRVARDLDRRGVLGVALACRAARARMRRARARARRPRSTPSRGC